MIYAALFDEHGPVDPQDLNALGLTGALQACANLEEELQELLDAMPSDETEEQQA